mmetsp:Transcript_19388/g.34350  ORF Transcript_19388/g.34350 Transcript_19388/m.34350 type:complete len:306 (+) Transcript_19388:1550-2467(+)
MLSSIVFCITAFFACFCSSRSFSNCSRSFFMASMELCFIFSSSRRLSCSVWRRLTSCEYLSRSASNFFSSSSCASLILACHSCLILFTSSTSFASISSFFCLIPFLLSAISCSSCSSSCSIFFRFSFSSSRCLRSNSSSLSSRHCFIFFSICFSNSARFLSMSACLSRSILASNSLISFCWLRWSSLRFCCTFSSASAISLLYFLSSSFFSNCMSSSVCFSSSRIFSAFFRSISNRRVRISSSCSCCISFCFCSKSFCSLLFSSRSFSCQSVAPTLVSAEVVGPNLPTGLERAPRLEDLPPRVLF